MTELSGTAPSRPSRRDVLNACRRLTPVTVDVGPGQAKLASYMARVDGKSGAAFLVLSPIAADGMPDRPRRVVVRTSAHPASQFAVHAKSAIRVDERTVKIPLAGARLEWLRPRASARRVVDSEDPMMLFVPTAIEQCDSQGFPVVDFSKDVCAVEVGVPPHVGARFDPVEIVRDRALVRVGSAVVEEVIPWRAANGAARFRCRLRIDESRADRAEHRDDLVTDPLRVRRVVELAASAATNAWLDGGRGKTAITGIEVGADSMVLKLADVDVRDAMAHVGFELFTVGYELRVRVISRANDGVTLALPLVLRRRRRRRERRIEVPPARTLRVQFVNPISQTLENHVVTDLSQSGLGFEIDESSSVLWSGLLLEDACLLDGDRSISLGSLDVRRVEDRSSHCAIAETGRADRDALCDVLSTLKHPALTVHDGEDFRGMLASYRRAHVLYDYMTQNLEPVAPLAASNWRRLHKDGRDLVRTLLHADGRGGADATVTAVRAWEQGWMIQHFGAVRGPDQFRWSGELQRAIVEHVLLRPEGRFLFFFVNQKNASMNAFYERFFEATGTSEAIEHGTMDFWALPPRSAPPDADATSDAVVRSMRRREESIVARAAARALGPRTAAAASLLPGSIRLAALDERFRSIGLERRRRARVVTRRGRPELALMSEEMSAGVNLAWMLSAHWLLPIHGRSDDPYDSATHAALATVESEPAPSPYGERFVLVPGGCFSEALTERGWQCRIQTRTYVMNRAGLQRYYLYVADRYGAAEARSTRRRVRENVG